ncbi:MAG: sel1 repeat family protein [Alphaproteobacteria bacterium]|nr:sel1 repeat family protein [Alphaproteobacteria bacterium]
MLQRLILVIIGLTITLAIILAGLNADRIRRTTILAQQGDVDSQNELADSYLLFAKYGVFKLKFYNKAEEWYHRAARKNHVAAQTSLADIYYQGLGRAPDIVEAVRWYEPAAENGNLHATLRLADIFFYGRNDVAQDYELALQYYTQAADQHEDLTAIKQVALMYEQGFGTSVNDGRAAKWYWRAAERGDKEAQAALGRLFADGRGVPQDGQQQLYWSKLAAEQGDENAQVALGKLYLEGREVTQSDAEAFALFTKAAQKGNANAQKALGDLYSTDNNAVAQNRDIAIEWYEQAARNNQRDSFTALGKLYLNGDEETDKRKAYRWYYLAAKSGDEQAILQLEQLQQQITPDDIDIAVNNAENWLRQP